MLRALPIAEVVDRADLLVCPHYGATISAACCATRQAKARKGIGIDIHRRCLGCETGTSVERQTGGPVTLGRFAGQKDGARLRGGERRRGIVAAAKKKNDRRERGDV